MCFCDSCTETKPTFFVKLYEPHQTKARLEKYRRMKLSIHSPKGDEP